jgi:hypothetical protein
VLRPLDVIVAAILIARPDMAEEEALRHAKVLREVAREHAFDPFTGVAIIRHESGWHAQTVSSSGEDYGLAQIRARYIGACKNDPDPLKHPGKECQAVKRSLLDAETNIRTMGQLIREHRQLCRKKAGTIALHRWLASYQGRNYPKRKRWCQPGKQTWTVVRYRAWLEREVRRKRPRGAGR